MPAPVTLPELQKMHRMAATLVISDPTYLPVFERIEHELATYDAKDDAISRARAIAARQRAVCEQASKFALRQRRSLTLSSRTISLVFHGFDCLRSGSSLGADDGVKPRAETHLKTAHQCLVEMDLWQSG